MRTFICLIILVTSQLYLYAQTGSSGDPFTSFEQSANVTTQGIYYFDIDGTLFDTYIDNNGYVQIGIDFGDGTGSLPQSSSLNTSSRGILDASVLSVLNAANEIRISSSDGTRDVISNNSALLSRVFSNTTLHRGQIDNVINDSWTGTGATFFTSDAAYTGSTVTSLHERIFHPTSNANTFHWQPYINQQRKTHADGEIGSTEFLQIWLKYNATLPVELVEFKAFFNQEKSQVDLRWTTTQEINNAVFVVQHSTDGSSWQAITEVKGNENSREINHYTAEHHDIAPGYNYYRLKQIDTDGRSSLSPIESIYNTLSEQQISVYPNPTFDYLHLSNISSKESENKWVIESTTGQIVKIVSPSYIGNKKIQIDVSDLPLGLYIIRAESSSSCHQFIKADH